jgi:hypothetical protein
MKKAAWMLLCAVPFVTVSCFIDADDEDFDPEVCRTECEDAHASCVVDCDDADDECRIDCGSKQTECTRDCE